MRDIHVLSNTWAAEFHACTEKEAQVVGGVGSGKSQEASAWLIEKAIEFPQARLYYMGAAYPAMREGTAVTLCERLDDYGFAYDFTRSTLDIVIRSGPAKGVRFIPTSAETFRRLKGQLIDFIWADEAQEWLGGSDTIGGMAYDFLLSRLRISEAAQKAHPGLKPQIRLTANPPHRTSHWLYQKFVKNAQGRLFHVTTYDNALLTDRDSYIETLRGSMSPELFDIEVLGKWGNLGVGTVYKGFDQTLHVRSTAYDRTQPLIFTNDFGVDPRVALLIQVRPGGQGEQREVAHIVDEISIRNGNTDELIDEFCRRYPPEEVAALEFYGDPAGRARNSTTGATDWQMLEDDPRLVPYVKDFFVASAAPLIVDRVNVTNARLINARGEVGVVIDPSCEKIIDDFQHTAWKDGTRALDHGSKAKGILRTHWTDAFGYFAYERYGRGASYIFGKL
jgi:hypothetical protein